LTLNPPLFDASGFWGAANKTRLAPVKKGYYVATAWAQFDVNAHGSRSLEILAGSMSGLAAEHGDRIVGQLVYELGKTSIRLVNLGVNPKRRRRGATSALLDFLVGRLTVSRRRHLNLVVRETNLAAQKFLAAQGFRAVRVLRDYYQGPGEDGYFFTRRLGPPCHTLTC
jgi:ribosomal protein S18 acetylase RimI-like enzyme